MSVHCVIRSIPASKRPWTRVVVLIGLTSGSVVAVPNDKEGFIVGFCGMHISAVAFLA
jgi:hypothetical protein